MTNEDIITHRKAGATLTELRALSGLSRSQIGKIVKGITVRGTRPQKGAPSRFCDYERRCMIWDMGRPVV